jgi:NADH-quinone oxidoreductase subunit L
LYAAASVNFTSFLLALLLLIALIAGGWLMVFRSTAERQPLNRRWRGVYLNLYALMSREFYIADLYSRAGETILAASKRVNTLVRWV